MSSSELNEEIMVQKGIIQTIEKYSYFGLLYYCRQVTHGIDPNPDKHI